MDRFPQPQILILLTPPPPLHGLRPADLLDKKEWSRRCDEGVAKSHRKCWACGIPMTKAKVERKLVGLPIYDIDWGGGICSFVETAALCRYCASYTERAKLEVDLAHGRGDEELLTKVIRCGDDLTAHLRRPARPALVAAWDEWVMIIDGTPYPSRFTGESDWASYYHWLNATGLNDDNTNFTKYKRTCKFLTR